MKLLKVLVVGMTVLIAVGLALLGWGVSRNAAKPHGVEAHLQAVPALPTPPVASGGYFSAELPLAAGAHLEQMATTADRIILRVSGPDGDHILVLDPLNGHLAGTIALVPQSR